MIVVSLNNERERGEFAERAAKDFAENPGHWSYSDSGEVQPGERLALRWGTHNRAVLVLEVADTVPVVYMDLVPGPGIYNPKPYKFFGPDDPIPTRAFDAVDGGEAGSVVPRRTIYAAGLLSILASAGFSYAMQSDSSAAAARAINRFFHEGVLP